MSYQIRALFVLALLAPATLPGQTINGRIIDATTRQPVTAAAVRLLGGDQVVAVATSDANGRFSLTARGGGRHRIAATRLGFADAVTNVIELTAGESITVELQMSSEAVKVAPLTIDAPRDRYLESKGFYERMQSGNGDYMTGEEIRKRNAFALADLLRGLRGVKIQRSGPRNEVYFTGANCLPMIVLDGLTVRWGGKSMATLQPLEDLVPIAHIDGIEAYRGGSGIPPEFVGPNAGCGVILIWTRHK
ncbi:MAG: carboxypeptidase regulatory-like domain-containing protein [Longimicrobiales bacterium]